MGRKRLLDYNQELALLADIDRRRALSQKSVAKRMGITVNTVAWLVQQARAAEARGQPDPAQVTWLELLDERARLANKFLAAKYGISSSAVTDYYRRHMAWRRAHE